MEHHHFPMGFVSASRLRRRNDPVILDALISQGAGHAKARRVLASEVQKITDHLNHSMDNLWMIYG